MMALNQRFAVGLLAAAATIAHAQNFAKIEVKPAHTTALASRRVRVLANGDLVATSVNVITLISEAYDVPSNPSERLSPLPPWVYDERYDIEAKASPDTKPIHPSDSDLTERVRAIFRQVLAEKFHCVVQKETRSMAVYALTVAGNDPKLKASPASNCIFDTAQEGCHSFTISFGHPLNGNAINMGDLAHYIENWTELPVIDETSLTGVFTTHSVGWRPMKLPPPPPNSAGNVDFAQLQTLDEALGSLGLTLHKNVASVQVYAVKQIKQP